jgi:WD40 repeat protein
MRDINAAYQVLSDPEQRRRYDLARPPSPSPSPPRPAPAEPPRSTAPSPAAHPRSTERAGVVATQGDALHQIGALRLRDATTIVAATTAQSQLLVAAGTLDGRVALWDPTSNAQPATLAFATGRLPGVLHDVRLSPSGAVAAAWGFQLGTRIWASSDGRTLWNAGMNTPAGAMDLQLLDGPPRARLALPDAPAALADDDPFRWANAGREGTSLLTRPLEGVVHPAWAQPLHCPEVDPRRRDFANPGPAWRVLDRRLSQDGRSLLTFSHGRTHRLASAHILTLWDVEARSLTGAPSPRKLEVIAEPAGILDYPLAATPDLAQVALGAPGGVRIYTLRTGRHLALSIGPLPDDALLALSPDASLLTAADGASVRLWDTRTGAQIQTWECGSDVASLRCVLCAGRPCWLIGFDCGILELWA